MTRVGVRDLRKRASELLRWVERGETIEIANRGRPVALLGPLPDGSPLDRLRSTGEIEPASADIDDLPPPLAARGAELPSAVLARLRRHER